MQMNGANGVHAMNGRSSTSAPPIPRLPRDPRKGIVGVLVGGYKNLYTDFSAKFADMYGIRLKKHWDMESWSQKTATLPHDCEVVIIVTDRTRSGMGAVAIDMAKKRKIPHVGIPHKATGWIEPMRIAGFQLRLHDAGPDSEPDEIELPPRRELRPAVVSSTMMHDEPAPADAPRPGKPQTFAEAIRERRIAEKLSQRELGEMLGTKEKPVAQKTVSGWEAGTLPMVDTYQKLRALWPDLPEIIPRGGAAEAKEAAKAAERAEAQEAAAAQAAKPVPPPAFGRPETEAERQIREGRARAAQEAEEAARAQAEADRLMRLERLRAAEARIAREDPPPPEPKTEAFLSMARAAGAKLASAPTSMLAVPSEESVNARTARYWREREAREAADTKPDIAPPPEPAPPPPALDGDFSLSDYAEAVADVTAKKSALREAQAAFEASVSHAEAIHAALMGGLRK